ncbi:prephenate dehydrogenase [Bacillus timonensis]|nr:prephenate dehydrogenase [Bacillus timonensis]
MGRNVLIIGMGLIGGSISLAIKKEHPTYKIVGYDIQSERSNLAKSLRIIDEVVDSIDHSLDLYDFIIIAVPVTQTEEMIEKLANSSLKHGVIITDVGSTKQQILKKARILVEKGICFIGGHPMAGSHKSGIVAAKEHLFENAFYILTPSSQVTERQIEELITLLTGTKALFIQLTAEEHDLLTGVVSHFPHIIAASLVHQAEDFYQSNELIKRLAAGGFRDITRIASSSPTMWRDILMHNRVMILDIFEKWISEMEKVRSMIELGDGDKIYSYFEKAKDFRDGLPVRVKGAIPSFYDLYVDVPDYPGVISEITGYLAKEKISITNIRIIETREEIYGVLRISFQTEEDREKASVCIEKATSYLTYNG